MLNLLIYQHFGFGDHFLVKQLYQMQCSHRPLQIRVAQSPCQRVSRFLCFLGNDYH